MLNTKTLKQFQEELGSKNPTPGGGVVAALSASFAASLIEMVCNLSQGKAILRIRKRVIELRKKLTKLADEDAKAFDRVMVAYRTKPRSVAKIRKSLNFAIVVPSEVRKHAQELEKLAIKVAKIGNKNAYSDAKTALHLSQAAQKSALENIKINKESIKKLETSS